MNKDYKSIGFLLIGLIILGFFLWLNKEEKIGNDFNDKNEVVASLSVNPSISKDQTVDISNNPTVNPNIHSYNELGFGFEYPNEKMGDSDLQISHQENTGGSGFFFNLYFDNENILIQGTSVNLKITQGMGGFYSCTAGFYPTQKEKFQTFTNTYGIEFTIADGNTITQTKGINPCEKGFYYGTARINNKTKEIDVHAKTSAFKDINSFKEFLNTFKVI